MRSGVEEQLNLIAKGKVRDVANVCGMCIRGDCGWEGEREGG